MPVYPVLRSAMTTSLHSSEVGKETNIAPIVNTHQVQSSQNPTVAPWTTREQLIKTEKLTFPRKRVSQSHLSKRPDLTPFPPGTGSALQASWLRFFSLCVNT